MTLASGLFGSPTSLPATRGTVAISVVGIVIDDLLEANW